MIVTNGTVAQQSEKRHRTGLDGLLDRVVISEAAGVNTPDPRIFALAVDGLEASAETWMVSDHPSADIEGGRVAKTFPWLLALPTVDRETCAQDLVDAARGSFSTDQPQLVIAEMTSWKETAAAIAAGLGSAALEWLDDDELVERA